MYRRIILVFLVLALLISSTTACRFGGLPKKAENSPRGLLQSTLSIFKWTARKVRLVALANARSQSKLLHPKKLRIGFFEEEVGGSGPQWRASGWMAAIIGSFLLGREVSNYKFSIDVGGYIDSPSDGALITSAVLACLLGDEIKKDVTMTGTINPDGTIGPIGGIPPKLDGAKKAKKKKVLIPTGQRYDYDAKTQQSVDVVALGEKKGLEVVEVASIYEAYKELTGKELPKIAGATKDRAQLPSETYEKVKAKTKKWYSKYLEERAKYDQVVLQIDTSGLDAMAIQADQFAQKGDEYLRQGLVASAYGQIISAILYASMAYHAKKSAESYINATLAGGDGASAAANYLDTVNPSGVKIDALLDELKLRKPQTLSDTMVLADAYGTLSIA